MATKELRWLPWGNVNALPLFPIPVLASSSLFPMIFLSGLTPISVWNDKSHSFVLGQDEACKHKILWCNDEPKATIKTKCSKELCCANAKKMLTQLNITPSIPSEVRIHRGQSYCETGKTSPANYLTFNKNKFFSSKRKL